MDKGSGLDGWLGFRVEADDSLPAGVVQLRDPEDGKLLATAINVEVAAAPAPREPLPENAASMLADARLRILIRKIIEERGVAVAMGMVQRATLEAMHDARTSGRSTQGYIG